MAKTEQKQDIKTKEAVSRQQVADQLNQSCEELIEYGGFELLEGAVDGVKPMNPESKARKNIFLTETHKKGVREELKRRLKIWSELLSSVESVPDMIDQAKEKSEVAESLLKTNLQKAVEGTKELETAYRSVAFFYKNAEADKVKNIDRIVPFGVISPWREDAVADVRRMHERGFKGIKLHPLNNYFPHRF